MPTKSSPSKNASPPPKPEAAQAFSTGVSIRRVSDLIRDVDQGVLILNPPFQRRLVWTNVVKDHFLDTVIRGLPFPEIFIATGEIDTTSMQRRNLLVDGQQRVSTLREYAHGSPDLVLTHVTPYAELDDDQKGRFLDYEVAVRDLGKRTPDQIKDIFARINSTDFSLRAVERMNAQFSGAYKAFCDELSKHEFFNKHGTFSLPDLRRMRDLDFCVILTTTLLSTYYHRDSLNWEYLQRYNDAFPKAARIQAQLESVFVFLEQCGFSKKCRVWKKTDLFTLIVELSVYLKSHKLDPVRVKDVLEGFYSQVDEMYAMKVSSEELEARAPAESVFRYLKAATKATNDKYARLDRAEVIDSQLDTTLVAATKLAEGGGVKRPAARKPKGG